MFHVKSKTLPPPTCPGHRKEKIQFLRNDVENRIKIPIPEPLTQSGTNLCMARSTTYPAKGRNGPGISRVRLFVRTTKQKKERKRMNPNKITDPGFLLSPFRSPFSYITRKKNLFLLFFGTFTLMTLGSDWVMFSRAVVLKSCGLVGKEDVM